MEVNLNYSGGGTVACSIMNGAVALFHWDKTKLNSRTG